MTHDVPVVIQDVYADARVPHTVYRTTFVRSLALVPVGAPEPVAAIGAYWAHPYQATEDEVCALQLLADHLALALENVRLYDDVAAALRQEQEARLAAEAAIAAKDEFLALVAHELRQPLHASLAAIRMMAVRISRESGEHARSVIERQVTQMTRLVEDLVDAARIVRGQIALHPSATDLGAVVTRATDTLRPLMAERRHVLTITAPEQPVWLQADAPRLEQVLTNLLTNAAKYTDAGGRIGIEVSHRDGHASVVVRDSGRGIDPATIPRLFTLFTRGVSDVRGFGVGLAVAKRLVELHGGSITASSAGLGRGAEFEVSLPIAPSG
jgi:signal transduction histidine kinase